MHITILAVGRLKEKYLREAQAEYLKRLSAYAGVNMVEVADEAVPEGASPAVEEAVKLKEAGRLAKHIHPGAYVVALDREGGRMTSEGFSDFIAGLGLEGKSQITFIIGGTLGLSGSILRQAHHRLSFSDMTFPHQLMRIILLEQVFRAFKIARGEPYHK
ncbi:MAG: 23S rRNA (pseudouridine(1915)-N(3))-methyltransferase RlmH [Peptococcaceae bacterium]|nr:23S rRNA (pseudouridine(1915)-N(3))-methyltransferase RlmH [Peptococcaceae bacterium]